MFQGRVGRDYWQSARQARLSTSASPRERRFHEVLDEEYQQAQPPETVGSPVQMPATERTRTAKERLLWAPIGAAAALLYRTLRSRSRLP